MKLGNVLGDDCPEIWEFLKKQSGAPDPHWNFQGKFLVSKKGIVSTPKTDIEAEIASLMKE